MKRITRRRIKKEKQEKWTEWKEKQEGGLQKNEKIKVMNEENNKKKYTKRTN